MWFNIILHISCKYHYKDSSNLWKIGILGIFSEKGHGWRISSDWKKRHEKIKNYWKNGRVLDVDGFIQLCIPRWVEICKAKWMAKG